MAVAAVFAFVLLAGTACSALPSRIIGGNLASIEEFPSIVQVEFYFPMATAWGQSCAANILNSLYVVSAAHCFAGDNYDIRFRRVRAGTSIRSIWGSISYFDEVYNHPSYSYWNGLDGDIMVGKMDRPFVYSASIQQGAIVPQGFVLPDGLPVVYAGWGVTAEEGWPSPELREVTIYTINNDLCRQRYLTLDPPQDITKNMICAGILDVGGKDACLGDSGGPLYYDKVLVGIVSGGHGCANETYPGFSTAVSSYTDWIISLAV